MPEIIPQTVQMTPNGQVNWVSFETAKGTLLLPGKNKGQDAATAALLLADYASREPFARGVENRGRIYTAPDEGLVVKEASIGRPRNDFEDIRTQVALNTGFEALAAQGQEQKHGK